MRAALAFLLACPPASAGSFVVEREPRWELVAAAARLAEPPERRSPTRAGREADRALESLSSHAAVARARRLLSEGGGCALAAEAAALAWPPAGEPWSSFSRARAWRAFDAARAASRAREAELARAGVAEAEARAAAWFKRPPPPRRLWASPLASTAWDCDAPDPGGPPGARLLTRAGRAGGAWGWEPGWSQFGHSIEHEAAHAVFDPLVPARLPLEGAPPAGCNDGPGGGGWSACLREHLALAATLRLLAREKGEKAAADALARHAARGYPYLAAVARALAEAEKEGPPAEGYAAVEKAFVAEARRR